MVAINDVSLYEKFKITKYRIGSTQYKQEDCSPMLTQVYIKTWCDKRFRAINDFFGKDASVEASKWIYDQMNN
jgi:hypothetical protein